MKKIKILIQVEDNEPREIAGAFINSANAQAELEEVFTKLVRAVGEVCRVVD